jgi:hypothetical protein
VDAAVVVVVVVVDPPLNGCTARATLLFVDINANANSVLNQ